MTETKPKVVEITPEIIALLESAVAAIYARCQEFCISDCDCHEEASKLKEIFGLE